MGRVPHLNAKELCDNQHVYLAKGNPKISKQVSQRTQNCSKENNELVWSLFYFSGRQQQEFRITNLVIRGLIICTLTLLSMVLFKYYKNHSRLCQFQSYSFSQPEISSKLSVGRKSSTNASQRQKVDCYSKNLNTLNPPPHPVLFYLLLMFCLSPFTGSRPSGP